MVKKRSLTADDSYEFQATPLARTENKIESDPTKTSSVEEGKQPGSIFQDSPD